MIYMQEREIKISSVNRQKIGRSQPEDFSIKFNPPIHLSSDMKHELAVNRVSMTYSWHNINNKNNNNKIKYSKDSGANWETITFVDGMYSYDDLNNYITQAIKQNDDQPANGVAVKLYFVLSSYRVVVELGNKWRLDISNSKFGDLIGFEPKIITQTDYSSKLPNITNSIDVININCDLITDSISDGVLTNTLIMIPTDNLRRSFPFTFEPKRALFSPVSKDILSEIRITVTDALNRPIDLNNIDWFMSLILRSSFV